MGRRMAMGLAMAMMAALAAPATADARPPRADGALLPAARVVPVAMDRLDVRESYGDLVVRYKVARATFRQAQALGATLDLHVRLDDGTVRVMPLRRAQGRVVVDLPRRGDARQAAVWIEGRGPRGVRYAGMVVRGHRVEVVAVALRDRHPAPRVPPRTGPAFHAGGAEVVDACGRAMIGNDATLACVAEARAFRTAPVAAIRACSDAMIGNDATLRCIAAAARVFPDAPGVVRACERASIGNEATLQCIEASGRGAYAYGF